jgi:hypothetical protein
VYDYIIAADEGGSKQDDDEDSGTESLQLEEEDCVSRKSSCVHPILSAHLAQLSVVQMQIKSLTPVDESASGHPHHQLRQTVTKNAGV